MTFHNIVSLEGKTALVVGGGGLGTPIAQAFLENGAEVIIADIRNSISEELRKTAAIAGKEVRFVPVDLLSEESIVAAVEEAKQVTGRIDILVNAAGINKLERAEEYQTASWDDVLGINLRGLFLTTREVGKIMKEQHYGRILSISSVKSIIGTDRDYIAYCASKGGVNMFMKQIACEWGKYGITANAIAPTFTRTPINAFQLDDPVFYQKLVDRIPLGRICSAKDIGNAALFLCSDAAEFITGQVLAVDGGLTAKQ
ncbi:MAG: SDR family oxidoreductase [Lachnospiraceae bacterium]|nr:SDR family oxidoreductase [Lachnospiraceae bacterium]